MFQALATSTLLCAVRAAVGPTCESGGVRCIAGSGPMRESSLGLTEIVWIGPENRKVYLGSPSIVHVHGEGTAGTWLTSHDFFGNTSDPHEQTFNNTVQVLGNREDGTTAWEHVGNVTGMYWASLFVPPQADAGEVYLLGVSGNDRSPRRDVVISKSLDGGKAWTEPSVLFEASDSVSYHCAPTPVLVASDGRIYRAFETSNGTVREFSAMLMSTAEPYSRSIDLLQPASWRLSTSLPFDQSSMIPSSWGTTEYIWEEGNAVEAPNGDIYDILRINKQTKLAYNKAALTRLDVATGQLHFERMIDFPSTESKFVIRRSLDDGAYYSLTSDVTPTAVELDTLRARNHLVLAYSKDLYTWKICDTLVTDDTGFSAVDSARYTGFQYVDWQFDGEDILFAARTSYRGANSFHNANRMTAKRIAHYGARCSWLDQFEEVGYGWCDSAKAADVGRHAHSSSCAAACMLSATRCQSFAHEEGGACQLYGGPAQKSSGIDGIRCFNRKPLEAHVMV